MITSGLAIPTRQILTEILEPYEEIQAAALYGSVARGDSESHSDVDLLVICNGGRKRELYDDVYPVLSKQFNRLSLSVYSPREINFLAKAQSLFLLHLKRESLVLFDRTCLLTTVLSNFVAKASYEGDFRKSLDLFAPLNTVISAAPNSFHRLAYLYSLFRVYCVYLLAEQQIFEFSKAKMSVCLSRLRPGQAADIALLSQLRVLNANFFSGGEPNREFQQSIDGQLPSLDSSVLALGRIVGKTFRLTTNSYQEAVEAFLNAAQCYPLHLGYRLRTWFLLLVYDGLNLYCCQNHLQELRSFNFERLGELTQPDLPLPVKNAALESLEYLRNYPLKYFLLEESKIPLNSACSVLVDLSRVVRHNG
jgi:predicted nucleotidyltransferase